MRLYPIGRDESGVKPLAGRGIQPKDYTPLLTLSRA